MRRVDTLTQPADVPFLAAGVGSSLTFLCFDCNLSKTTPGRAPIARGMKAYRCASCVVVATAAKAARKALREGATS